MRRPSALSGAHVDNNIRTATARQKHPSHTINTTVSYVLVPVRVYDQSPRGHAGREAREQTGPVDASQSLNIQNIADKVSNR